MMKAHTKWLYKHFVVFGLISLYLLSDTLYAQTQYSNKLLADIHQQLMESHIKEDNRDEIIVPVLCKSKPIVIEKTSQGIVSHIGIKLFDRTMTAKYPSLLYPFVERYCLELLLATTEKEMATRMKMDRVKINWGRQSKASIKERLRNICNELSSDVSFSIICRNNRYIFSCVDKNQVALEMSFPVRYELINGYTKPEAESSFYPNLLMFQDTGYTLAPETDMFIYKDSLLSYNEDYYLTENFISTSYYKKDSDTITPIMSSDRMEESVYNLFNTGYDWQVEAQVTQNKYGEKKLSFNIPLAKLIHFLNQQNCMIYTGIEKYDKSSISGSIMAVNMELGYQHLLLFSFPEELIDNPQEHQVSIKMYGYIPIHNISSLFENKSKIK